MAPCCGLVAKKLVLSDVVCAVHAAVFDQPTKRIIWGEPSVESTYATMGDAVRTSTAATTAAAPISAKQRRKKEKVQSPSS